jgi:hypothetical protein
MVTLLCKNDRLAPLIINTDHITNISPILITLKAPLESFSNTAIKGIK